MTRPSVRGQLTRGARRRMMEAVFAALLSLTIAQLSFVPGDGGAIDLPARRLVPLEVEGGVAARLDARGLRIVWADQRRTLAGGPLVTDLFTTVWAPGTGVISGSTGSPLVLNPDGRHTRNPVLTGDATGLMLTFDEIAGNRSALRARSLAMNVDGGSGPFALAQGSRAPEVGSASVVHDGTTFVAGWWVADVSNSNALAFQRFDHSGPVGDGGLETWVPASPTSGPFLSGERTPVTIASNWDRAPTAHVSTLAAGTAAPAALHQRAGQVAGIIANGSNDPTGLLVNDAGALVDLDAPSLVYASSVSFGQRLPTQWAGSRVVALIHRPAGWTLGVINPGVSGLANTPWPRLTDGGTLRPLALAGDGGLFPFALEVQQAVLFLRAITPDGGSFSPAADATLISQTRAPQRDPSVVWSERETAFLVAYSEYTADRRWETLFATVALDGSSTLPRAFGNLSPLGTPGRPRVLRRPSSPGLALLIDTTTTSSALFEFLPTGIGYDLDAPNGLTQANNAGAALGDRNAIMWDRSTTVATSSGSVMLAPWTPPSCAAYANGQHWLFGFERGDGGALRQVRVNDAASTNFLSQTVAGLTGAAPVCATSTADGQVLIGVYEASDGALGVFAVNANARADGGVVPLRNALVFDGGAGATKPKAVPFGDSALLVGWETVAGVSAALVSDAGVTPLDLESGRALDARNLALATSPSGVVAVAWQEFSPALASSQIQVRLIIPPGRDAGVDGGLADGGSPGPDGGSTPDGGADAGGVSFDAGVTDADAGLDDGGVVDAGSMDGGSAVATAVVFAPVSCGCSSGPGAVAGLAVCLLRRWRRRIRLSGGPS